MEEYLKNYETYLKSNYVDDAGKFDEQAMNENNISSAAFILVLFILLIIIVGAFI